MTIRARHAAALPLLGLLGGGGSASPAESMDAGAVDAAAIDAGPVDAAAIDAPIVDATTTDTTPPSATNPDASVDSAAEGSLAFTVSLGTGRAVATFPEREALGFRFGFVDGVMGAVSMGDAGYVFFGSGRTEFPEAGTCSGDDSPPNTQGAYRFGVATDVITDNFGCGALIANGEVVADGGTQGPFDRDYVGGGPVLVVTSGGQRALVMTYHAEFHWGPTCNGAPCFYGTLGMAASVDDGVTFAKLGEIVQPAISRADWIATHAGASLSIGAGPFVLGDETGRPVDPATADPASTYVYVFFDDYDTTNAAPCGNQQCVGVRGHYRKMLPTQPSASQRPSRRRSSSSSTARAVRRARSPSLPPASRSTTPWPAGATRPFFRAPSSCPHSMIGRCKKSFSRTGHPTVTTSSFALRAIYSIGPTARSATRAFTKTAAIATRASSESSRTPTSAARAHGSSTGTAWRAGRPRRS